MDEVPGPVLVAYETTQVWVTVGDQAEEIPDFPLIPLRSVDRGCDRSKERGRSHELHREQDPGLTRAQSKQILNLVFLCERPTIDGKQQCQAAFQPLMKKPGDLRKSALVDAIL